MLDEQEKSVILGCDIIRSIPLFYCVKEHRIWVGDDAAKIAEKSKSVLQDENVNEFLRASYVTENETIFRGIYQVLPGEYVVISREDGSIFRKSYYEPGMRWIFLQAVTFISKTGNITEPKWRR